MMIRLPDNNLYRVIETIPICRPMEESDKVLRLRQRKGGETPMLRYTVVVVE